MTDPAAIDLKPYKQRRAERYPDEDWPYDDPIEDSNEDIDDLIAEVEALRERATQVQRSRPDPNDFESLTQNRNSWRRAAEGAQAREAELVVALDRLTGEVRACWDLEEPILRQHLGNTNYQVVADRFEEALTVLATTPAATLERAKARDEATGVLRAYYFAEMMANTSPTGSQAAVLGEIGLFLGKLGALDLPAEMEDAGI